MLMITAPALATRPASTPIIVQAQTPLDGDGITVMVEGTNDAIERITVGLLVVIAGMFVLWYRITGKTAEDLRSSFPPQADALLRGGLALGIMAVNKTGSQMDDKAMAILLQVMGIDTSGLPPLGPLPAAPPQPTPEPEPEEEVLAAAGSPFRRVPVPPDPGAPRSRLDDIDDKVDPEALKF